MYTYTSKKEALEYERKIIALKGHFNLSSNSAVIRFLVDKIYHAALEVNPEEKKEPEKTELASKKKAKQEKFVAADKLKRKEKVKEERYGADWDELFKEEAIK